MYCEQVRSQLIQSYGSQNQHYADALFDHLAVCPNCWTFASVLWQQETVGNVADTSVDTLDENFAHDQAWSTHYRRKAATGPGPFAHFAAATMVVLAASFILLQFWNNGPTPQPGVEPATIVMTPASVRYVDLMLTSAQAHNEATITLALGENLTLLGYPGMREISWPTSLQAGDNKLTLPLQLQNDEHGVITVNVTSGGLQKQMVFTVQPTAREQNTRVI